MPNFYLMPTAEPTITTQGVWRAWVNNTITITSATTDTTVVWRSWVTDANGTTGSLLTFQNTTATWGNDNQTTWGHWCNDWYLQTTGYLNPRAETEQEKADRLVRAEAQREAIKKAEQERLLAKEKARKLLVQHLNPTQKETFEKERYFIVELADGKKRYKIREGWSGNVDLLDEEGRVKHRYCIHPRIYCPNEDNMLAQKLLLETNESYFLTTANRHM